MAQWWREQERGAEWASKRALAEAQAEPSARREPNDERWASSVAEAFRKFVVDATTTECVNRRWGREREGERERGQPVIIGCGVYWPLSSVRRWHYRLPTADWGLCRLWRCLVSGAESTSSVRSVRGQNPRSRLIAYRAYFGYFRHIILFCALFLFRFGSTFCILFLFF